MRESVTVRDIRRGDVIHHEGSWWEVTHVVEHAAQEDVTLSVINQENADDKSVSLPPDEQVQVRRED